MKQKTAMYTKKSMGLILVDTTLTKILVIKKRYTYQYADFIFGRYDIKDHNKIFEMFSKMTMNEKLIIKTCRFDYMWFHLIRQDIKNDTYNKCHEKFKAFLKEVPAEEFNNMIMNSKHAESTIYEFPKGHKRNKNEPNIVTAIRETEEETNIAQDNFVIIPGIKQIYSIEDNGVRYLVVYYVGKMLVDVDPVLNASSVEQCSEIDTIKWMDLNDIKKIKNDVPILQFAKRVLTILRNDKKHTRNL